MDQICEEKFGPELLSYMYGELDGRRSADFESHLQHCDACAAELANVADARLGVIEWRREDFEPLATPVIVLPAIEQMTAVEKRGIAAVIESIKNLPAWASAGMALAPAAVLFGVFYFGYFNVPATRNDVATTATTPASAEKVLEPVATVNNGSEKTVVAVETNTRDHNAIAAKAQPVAVRRNTTPERIAAKHFVSQPAPVRTETASAVKTIKKSAPRLSSFDEEDDKSLRLADLFAQIGTSEEEE